MNILLIPHIYLSCRDDTVILMNHMLKPKSDKVRQTDCRAEI